MEWEYFPGGLFENERPTVAFQAGPPRLSGQPAVRVSGFRHPTVPSPTSAPRSPSQDRPGAARAPSLPLPPWPFPSSRPVTPSGWLHLCLRAERPPPGRDRSAGQPFALLEVCCSSQSRLLKLLPFRLARAAAWLSAPGFGIPRNRALFWKGGGLLCACSS